MRNRFHFPWRALGGFLAIGLVMADGAEGNGESLYLDKEYQAAYEAYDGRLESGAERHRDKLEYGAGTAAYKAENYGAAAEHLGRAILTEDAELRGKAYYNLGNTLFQLGRSSEDPEEMKGQWEAAIDHYAEAESLGGSVAANAEYNRELVQRYLDALQEQEEEEDQQQEQGEEQQEKEEEQQEQEQKQEDQQQDQQEGEQQDQQEGEQQEGEQQEGKQQQEGSDGDEESESSGDQAGQEEEKEGERLGEKEGQEGDLKREGQEEDGEKGDEVSAYELTPEGKLSEAAARALLESLEGQEVKAPYEVRRSQQRRGVIRNW